MKTRHCLLILVACTSLLFASTVATTQARQNVQQPPQPFEPFIARVRDQLKLSPEQTDELRQILAAHESKINELRRRAQTNPFAPQLPMEADKEQRAIRDELAEHLNDEQKARLASLDMRLPIPIAPPFVLINIPPRARSETTAAKPLASSERFVQTPATSRNARLTEDQKILHLLNRAMFGPRPGDLDRVRQLGIAKFLDEQLHPETIDDSELEKRLAVLPTEQMSSSELYQFYPPPPALAQRMNEKNPPPVFGRPQQIMGELIQQKLVRAVSSNRQLQEVMTDFWFNHFNVFAQKEADQWLITSYERDVIRPHALGKFRDLLTAVAESPAMMFYLDNWLSSAPDAKEPRPPAPPRPQNQRPAAMPDNVKPAPGAGSEAMPGPNPQPADSKNGSANQQPQRPPQRKRDINENYARELMELHTLGVDGGYTQRDVQEVARCFTGWTIDRPFQGGGFVFRPWMHDAGAKTVLGVSIPAGGAMSDGLRVIEILSRHPSTARFISKKLCQRFVADDPPPQLIERVAQVFLKTDGDIREVVRAILTSQEFYAASAFRSKVKSPLELAASAIRAVDGDTNGAPALHEWFRRMGEPLYQYQFPTGYSEVSSKWMNTGAFLNRLNFAVALANNQIPGTSYDPARLVSIDATTNADAMMNQLAALIVHTELSAESRRAVLAGLAEQPSSAAHTRAAMDTGARPAIVPAKVAAQTDASAARRRIAQIIGLLFGTTEFQRR
ncbi:MAG TPA: DUF1800 domain-containing protein [Blastocatellia bacterium]|nr:DUF1800 domain-containing protein [Blastocatellia bacterium]